MASTITGAGDLIGTMMTVSGTVDAGQSGQELAGMVATATFAGGSTATCTFTITALCSAANFSVLVDPDTSQTSSADWIITNLNVLAMTSLSLNGAYVTGSSSPQQLVVFNPALQGGRPW